MFYILQILQVEVENEVLQSHNGPDTLDLIILANMMIYIADSAEHDVTRCLQWLKPGGHLLIVGRDRSTYMDNILGVYCYDLFFN